jgi:hypothetical protein
LHGWSLTRGENLTTPLAERRLRPTSALLEVLEERGLVGGEDCPVDVPVPFAKCA